MSSIMSVLFEFFGNILAFIYHNLTPSNYKYGIAIIIFTVLVKLILLPIAIKQQRAMIDMQKIQPHIEEIRNKYKGDMNKMNEETMKLYAEHKVNPLGGCLPALVQLPIFIALYGVITQPLKYILKFEDRELLGINHALNFLVEPMKSQIHMVEKAKELIANAGTNVTQNLVNKMQSLSDSNILVQLLSGYNLDIPNTAALIEKASTLSMDFLGINLAQFPNEFYLRKESYALILIPILAALTTYLSSKLSTAMAPAVNNPTQNSMLIMMPFMTLFITYTLPAGLGLYWIISNIFQMIQQYFLNKYMPREVTSSK